MNDLTHAEAEKLFNQTSRAISASDDEKLNALYESEESQEETEMEDVSDELEDSTSEEESASDEQEVNFESESPDDTADSVANGEDEEPDELTKLKDQLAMLKSENHKLKSQAGRAPVAQRQVAELTKKLEELQNASTPSNLPSAKLAPKLQETLKGIEETDPELARTIAAAIASASDEIASDNLSRSRETLSMLRDMHLEEQKQEQMSILLDEFPNAIEIFRSDSWKSWKQEQSAAVQQLAGSGLARDVAFAFDLYAKAMVEKHPELAASASNNPQAEKIAEARQQRKTSSVQVATKNAPAKQKMPDDPDAIFKQAYAAISKERLGR